MTAMSCNHGDYPIFGGSTLSVTLTVGRLREHGCRPFWVSRLHHWDSRIAKPALLLLTVQ